MDLLYARFGNLFPCLNQPWLSQANLVDFSQSIYWKGAALDNCWGFIDGTVRPVARPGEHEKVLFNGHKRVHVIKCQSIVAPNGLIVNLLGPVEGRRHGSGMLAMSGLLPMLETHCLTPAGQHLCLYGDPAYPLRVHLQGPFKGAALTAIIIIIIKQSLRRKHPSRKHVVFREILHGSRVLRRGFQVVGRWLLIGGDLH